MSLTFVANSPSPWALFGYDAFLYFRPVKNLLWFGFLKMAPLGFEWCHLVAIVIGALSFFPVLALCRRILGSEWKGLAAASVWLFAPTLVSSAAWLSCVNVRIMVIFAALAITSHDKAWESGTFHLLQTALAGVFLFLSLVSYECAIAVVPILFLFDLLLRPGRLRLRSARMAHVAYWMAAAVYLALRFLAGGRESAGYWIDAERWQLVVSSPWFTEQHFASWFWPFGRFTVLGSYRWGDVSWWVLVACSILGFCIFLSALLCRNRRPILSFCILFALFGFAPASNCLGFGNGPYGDYYLALASIGLAAGCVELAEFLSKISGAWRRLALLMVATFAFTRTVAVFEAARWARFWGRGDLAFAESVRNYPKFNSNKLAYLQFLSDEGRYEEAFELGQELESRIDPDSRQMGTICLVRALYAINVSHDADEAFRNIELCEQHRDFSITTNLCHFYRGCVFEDILDEAGEAEREYTLALGKNWDVHLVPCADRLARLKAIRGERNEAIALWEKAEETDPDNVTVL